MRSQRTSLVALCLALLTLIVWWFWAGRPPNQIDTIAPPEASSSTVKSRQSEKGDPLKPSVATQLQALMNDSNRPINFFGKVIDQHANPIGGVKVTLQIRRTVALAAGGIGDTFDYPILITDEGGCFALTGANGALLAMKSLEKSGYEPSPKALRNSYWYWREPKDAFHPNVDRPEIFRMWKKAGAEKLIRNSISASLPYDGTPTIFDLTQGPVVTGGDLRVTLTRNPQQITYGQRAYDWTLTIESTNGGVLESNDEQMYLAPSDEYQPRIVVQMPATSRNWTDEKSLRLYLKLQNGQQYARAEIKVLVGSDRATTPFYITSYINPSGSRNLEYGESQSANLGR